jgi:hypothetical protein
MAKLYYFPCLLLDHLDLVVVHVDPWAGALPTNQVVFCSRGSKVVTSWRHVSKS